jgi:hypothetical protein
MPGHNSTTVIINGTLQSQQQLPNTATVTTAAGDSNLPITTASTTHQQQHFTLQVPICPQQQLLPSHQH